MEKCAAKDLTGDSQKLALSTFVRRDGRAQALPLSLPTVYPFEF